MKIFWTLRWLSDTSCALWERFVYFCRDVSLLDLPQPRARLLSGAELQDALQELCDPQGQGIKALQANPLLAMAQMDPAMVPESQPWSVEECTALLPVLG